MLLGSVSAGSGAQTPVYKCRDAAGQTSYQDEPCPPGTERPAPVLAPAPPYVPPAPPSASTTPQPQSPAGATAASPIRLPPPPLPALFACERYDGQESYVTDDPVPRVYQVPIWAVLPNRSIAAGGGVGTARPPPPGSGANSLLGAYTTVQDNCHRMGRAVLCDHWSRRAETVRKQLMTAFKDTRPGLEQEQAGLRGNRAMHCGG